MIRIAFCQTNRLFILLERAEKEIRFSMANSTFKMKMDIDRHGPRLMPNNCTNLNPPYFSLPSTFNIKFELNLKIWALLLITHKVRLSMKFDEKYNMSYIIILISHM